MDRTRIGSQLRALALAPLLGLAAAPAPAAVAQPSVRALLGSRELWATIDVCSPHDQPNVLGIRGSMPGDGNARDGLYMSFTVQYRSGARWLALGKNASSAFVSPGNGAVHSRQDGTSFVIAPATSHAAFALRGLVTFQWRRGRRVIATTQRATTSGRRSLAGADPAGYSAAECSLG